jgi:hypothetical protein
VLPNVCQFCLKHEQMQKEYQQQGHVRTLQSAGVDAQAALSEDELPDAEHVIQVKLN